MQATRGKTREGARGDSDQRRRLIGAAGLLLAVLALLLAAALLQADPADASARPAAPTVSEPAEVAGPFAPPGLQPATPPPAPGTQPPPRSEPEPPPTTEAGGVAELGRRAIDDAARLGADLDGWTLQLVMDCEPDNVRRLLAAAGDGGRMYLLRKTYRGRSCFRVCWGRYATREDALGAADLPPALARIGERPLARRVADVLKP